MTRLKVLISAYACRPGMGSEPGVGWNTARELAKHHDVWVLTRSDNRLMIEANLVKNPMEGFQFIYLDLPGVDLWKRGLLGVHMHYYLWQIKAYWIARQLHREIELDILHHVTYVRYSSPSFLALLPVPFIWGPVGGGESTPKAFWRNFHLRGKLYEMMRGLARFLGERDPFVHMTARRSCIAYATTEDTAHRLKAMGCNNVKVLSQVGLSPQEVERSVHDPQSNPESMVLLNPDIDIDMDVDVGALLSEVPTPASISGFSSTEIVRFISIGRFLHWKGFHLGLQAFAQASLPPESQYWIVGKGPEETALHTLAAHLGIASQVQFLTEMPRTELLDRLGTCLALIHPSLHESGGFVCLEAMAVGCPVVCLDLGGPAIQVTSTTGFKVAAHNPEQAIAEMANILTRLARDPALRVQMGQAGQSHVKECYSWEAKAALFSQVYQESVDRKVIPTQVSRSQ